MRIFKLLPLTKDRRINHLSSAVGTVSFSIQKSLWLYFMFVPMLFLEINALNTFSFILMGILTLTTVGIGHSVGLHRGVIHKSYRTSRLFRNISLYLFTLTGMGSPHSWLKQHYYRDYWQNRPDCPRFFRYQHSLLTDYWWNLHMNFKPTALERYQIPESDLKDPFILWLHKTWIFHNLLLMLLVYFISDLNTMLFVVFLRSSIIILGHWFIGYASHKFGYYRYKIKNADESGYNNVILGLLSFGEGFHNNHHSHPSSAKFSMQWYEIDMGWFLIWFLKKLRIITDVKNHSCTLKTTALPSNGSNWKFS